MEKEWIFKRALGQAYLNTFVVVFQAVPELSFHALLQQTFHILVHAKLGVVFDTLLCAGGFSRGGCLQSTTGTVMKVVLFFRVFAAKWAGLSSLYGRHSIPNFLNRNRC